MLKCYCFLDTGTTFGYLTFKKELHCCSMVNIYSVGGLHSKLVPCNILTQKTKNVILKVLSYLFQGVAMLKLHFNIAMVCPLSPEKNPSLYLAWIPCNNLSKFVCFFFRHGGTKTKKGWYSIIIRVINLSKCSFVVAW